MPSDPPRFPPLPATPPGEPVRWTGRRWVYTAGALFAFQIVLICYFAEGPPTAARVLPFSTHIHLVTDSGSIHRLNEASTFGDPTLFALPHPHGFSGAAWLSFERAQHRLHDWTEPPRWLDLEQDWLARTFARFVSTNTSDPLLIADKPLPGLTGYRLDIPGERMPTNSSITVQGSLAGRPILRPPELPSWPHSDVLEPTVIEIVVDAEGRVFARALLEVSGLPEADEYALQAAAQLQFQSDNVHPSAAFAPARLTWGQLVFRWHTLPVSSATTDPPAAPGVAP